jgi:hypothetical protein
MCTSLSLTVVVLLFAWFLLSQAGLFSLTLREFAGLTQHVPALEGVQAPFPSPQSGVETLAEFPSPGMPVLGPACSSGLT